MQIDRRVGQIFSCYICCSLRHILGFTASFQSVIFNQNAVFLKKPLTYALHERYVTKSYKMYRRQRLKTRLRPSGSR